MKKIRFPFPTSRNDELRGGAGWDRIETSIQEITGFINSGNDAVTAAVEAAEAAQDAAEIAASQAMSGTPEGYSDVLASMAEEFSTEKAYTAGTYVWRNSKLYLFTSDHAEGAWTGTDAEEAVISDELSDLKSEITQVEDNFTYVVGKNLLDTSKCVEGYLNSDGTIHANPSGGDWVTTDFIDVSGFEYITASRNNNGNRENLGMYFFLNYDSSKTIAGSQISTASDPYQIPDGVKYIRFSYHSSYVEPMVEHGTVKTSYVPYEVYTRLANSDYTTVYESLPNKLHGLRWCAFGDSLTEKNTKANKNYTDYIAEDLDLVVYNLGVSGSGYARGDSSSFAARMANLEYAKLDFLTIFGSFNDAGSGLEIGTPSDTGNSTICACINTTLDFFYSLAPFKPIGLITPCPWKTVQPNNTWGQNYADAIIAIGKLRGIPVLDLFRCSGIRPWAGDAYIAEYYTENDTADEGVHPNSKGHKMFLYPHIKQFILELIQGLPT